MHHADQKADITFAASEIVMQALSAAGQIAEAEHVTEYAALMRQRDALQLAANMLSVRIERNGGRS